MSSQNSNIGGKAKAPSRTQQSEHLQVAPQLTIQLGELSDQLSHLIGVIEQQQDQVSDLETLVVDLRETIAARKTIKESYTTAEVAGILGKKPYTVREWCRLQRINAYKAQCGRGSEEEWRVSHDELERLQNEGLLPVPSRY